MARNRYDVDEDYLEEFNLKNLLRLKKYVIPYLSSMVFVIVLMLISSALTMLIPIFFQRVMDIYIPKKDMEGVVLMGVLTLLIAVIAAASLGIRVKRMGEIGQNIIYDLRFDIFSHLQELPFSYYDSRPHGKIQVRVVNYVNGLSDLLSNGIVNTITDLCNLIFIIVFMAICDVKLTMVCLLGLPVLATIIFIIKKAQRRAWQDTANKMSNLNAYIAESINGIKVTQSFVREEKNAGILNNLSGKQKTSWMRAVSYNYILSPCVDFISIITTCFIYVLGVSRILAPEKTLTVGILIAFTAYIGRFWTPINTIAAFYNSLINAMSYMERIFETIDEPVVVRDKDGAKEMPGVKGLVCFENVTFCYEEGKNVLENVSFKVNPGETVAFVGPTGAGKSTIVNLLSRFYDINDGKVTIDGINISDVSLASLRKQMGIMMQDSFIFSGTIMDNIRYGNVKATDEDVIKAAKTVCAHDFIEKMEDGYNTEVNERGSRLSAGQRQLISFARALLANPKILILDEATSSIDTETEMLLQQGLKELLRGRTSFIIAHRLSTIRDADRIMYVDDGKVIESGNHEELIELRGKYYELYMSQFDFLSNKSD